MKARGLVLDPEMSVGLIPAAPLGTWLDRSRFGNNGTLANHAHFERLPSGLWVPSFDGVDDDVSFGTGASLNNTTGITVRIWIKPVSVAAQQIICGDSLQSLFWLDGVNLVLNLGTGGIWWTNGATSNNPAIVAGVWQRVVGTWGGGIMKLYKNGAEVAAYIAQSTMAGPLDALTTSYYLAQTFYGIAHFSGPLGLPCVNNHALSAGQVLQDFEATRRWFGL